MFSFRCAYRLKARSMVMVVYNSRPTPTHSNQDSRDDDRGQKLILSLIVRSHVLIPIFLTLPAFPVPRVQSLPSKKEKERCSSGHITHNSLSPRFFSSIPHI